jgi:peptidoglycan/LPS O-acetylase OafA/YrhL
LERHANEENFQFHCFVNHKLAFNMKRYLWLDGTRGLAAAAVAVSHATLLEDKSIFGFLSRSYWDVPSEENHSILQLPPLRLLFSGGAMVCLFLVISGYAISLPLLNFREACDNGTQASLFRHLGSTATRRIFRIYLPVIILTTITQLLYFFNIYQFKPPNKKWVWGLRPLEAPWSHFKFLVSHNLHLLDITYPRLNLMRDRPDLRNFAMQLWTMPVEYRGSCVVYLLIMTSTYWRPQPRRLVFASIAGFWFYIGQWDIFCFIAGLYLAEGDIMSKAESEGEINLSSDSSASERSAPFTSNATKQLQRAMPDWVRLHAIQTALCFFIGMYFLCFCEDQSFSTEYRLLASLQSSQWVEPETAPSCYRSLGAVLVIYGISQSGKLQWLLDSRWVQYLGHISFSLYLVHQSVYFIFKRPIRNLLWYFVTGTHFPSTIIAYQDAVPFWIAWLGSVIFCGIIMVLVADLWTRVIDKKCLEVSRRVENWLTRSVPVLN